MNKEAELIEVIENILRDKTEFFLSFETKEADFIINTLATLILKEGYKK